MRKIIGLSLSALAAVALGFWGTVAIIAARRGSAMERQVGELIREAQARDGRRPVAWGDAEPGNAWDEYTAALEELAAGPSTSTLFKEFLGRSRNADRVRVEREVEARAGALARLSRGASKAESRAPFRWEDRGLLSYAGEGVLPLLSQAAMCKARLLREAGNARAALRTLLETAQFGRDVACNSSSDHEWEGLRVLDQVFEEMEDLFSSKALKEEDLVLLERGLQTLDESLTRDGRSLLNEVAHLGHVLLREEQPYLEVDGVFKKRRPIVAGLDHAFSMKLLKTDAFTRWLAAARAYAEAGPKPWDEVRGVYNEGMNLLERFPENPAVSRLSLPTLETRRSREARLRLLRMAARFLRTAQVESFADPFGAAQTGLLYRVDGNLYRFWSRGPNGIDESGTLAPRPLSGLGTTAIIGPPQGLADDIGVQGER